MRKLGSVQKIISLNSIPNSDNILVCEVLGWRCVVSKKDEYKIGDLVCYFEIDSIMPKNSNFEFLKDRKYRIKTIKLRGQISQGLVMPLSILPDKNWKEGDDITDVVGVKYYNPQAELEQKIVDEKLAISNNKVDKFFKKYSWYRQAIRFFTGKKEKGWPKFIKKTDEDRIQLFPNICEEYKDVKFQVTEKLDGQSGTYFLVKNKNRFLWFGPKYIFGVCSRNVYLKNQITVLIGQSPKI